MWRDGGSGGPSAILKQEGRLWKGPLPRKWLVRRTLFVGLILKENQAALRVRLDRDGLKTRRMQVEYLGRYCTSQSHDDEVHILRIELDL
jgi:hypothetical protein